MWQKTYVWNSMPCDAYEFLRRNLHFADNYMHQPEGSEGYDPLWTLVGTIVPTDKKTRAEHNIPFRT